jgi:Carboxypeptidase regulatory-like domain
MTGMRMHGVRRSAAAAKRGAARHLFLATLLFAFWAAAGQQVLAQSTTVSGVARDALQRPLAGVTVRLEMPDGKVVTRGTTDKDGRFSLRRVAPGIYSLVGEKADFETATAVVTVTAKGAASDLTLASKSPLDLQVTEQMLTAARFAIEPRIGATVYTLTQEAIANQPGGDNIPLNQTLLQAPGVSQDSFGQFHLRNDQYRINGVILPEGINVFGQSLSSRFASSIDLITGSLPAQYGLYTTGIVDIQTKSGESQPGGYVGLYGGSLGWFEPSAEYGGSAGNFNYYVTGDYLQNDLGIENPTSSYRPIHDFTQQLRGFAYLEDIIDPSSKISVMLGGFQGSFQIPNNPGQVPVFQYENQTTFNSAQLNETQQESNDFVTIAYLKSTQDYDFQLAAFSRYSSLDFSPDPIGDLMFNGIAQNAVRTDISQGIQADGTYRAGGGHTLVSAG